MLPRDHGVEHCISVEPGTTLHANPPAAVDTCVYSDARRSRLLGHRFRVAFFWTADGEFDELRVERVPRPSNVPPGQAVPASGEQLKRTLSDLGKYVLEPITVAPFVKKVGSTTFGWLFNNADGRSTINIEPGDFICYYEPWDGYEYDT